MSCMSNIYFIMICWTRIDISKWIHSNRLPIISCIPIKNYTQHSEIGVHIFCRYYEHVFAVCCALDMVNVIHILLRCFTVNMAMLQLLQSQRINPGELRCSKKTNSLQTARLFYFIQSHLVTTKFGTIKASVNFPKEHCTIHVRYASCALTVNGVGTL